VAATFGCGPELIFILCAANVRRWQMKRERSSRFLVMPPGNMRRRNIHNTRSVWLVQAGLLF
jgi:hypothetical protein